MTAQIYYLYYKSGVCNIHFIPHISEKNILEKVPRRDEVQNNYVC